MRLNVWQVSLQISQQVDCWEKESLYLFLSFNQMQQADNKLSITKISEHVKYRATIDSCEQALFCKRNLVCVQLDGW